MRRYARPHMATGRTRGFNGDGGEERWGCLSFHPVDRRWPPRLRESHTCTLGSFLGPYPDGGRPGQVRIVVVSAPGDMRGLNQRELEILGLLVEDWSDQCISAAMGLPLPIVAENVRGHPGETRRRNARPGYPARSATGPVPALTRP